MGRPLTTDSDKMDGIDREAVTRAFKRAKKSSTRSAAKKKQLLECLSGALEIYDAEFRKTV